MLGQLYPYLTLSGLAILLVLAYLTSTGRRMNRVSMTLIRHNEAVQFDALALLREAQPLLAATGVEGIAWRGEWFGMPVAGHSGEGKGIPLVRELKTDEIILTVTLLRSPRRGEQRYFSDLVVETFFLLLQNDLWLKTGSVHAAFSQTAQWAAFLLHDMCNLAQMVQLVDDQVREEPIPSMVERLQASLPLIAKRADRLMTQLRARTAASGPRHPVDVGRSCWDCANIYGLSLEISGRAIVALPPGCLENACDNLMKNYADLAARGHSPRLTLALEQGPTSATAVLTDKSALHPTLPLERLFEPFVSTTGGLGYGLYGARQHLRAAGGELTAQLNGTGCLSFSLHMPAWEALHL